MWARGEALKELSRCWSKAMQPLLYFLPLFWSCPGLCLFLSFSPRLLTASVYGSDHLWAQPQLLSVLLRSAIHYTYAVLAPRGSAACSGSGAKICLSPPISCCFAVSFPPLRLLSCPHIGSLIYPSFVNSSSLFTSSPGMPLIHLLQPLQLSPPSMSVSFLICLLVICAGNPSKETPLPHISPSSSLTHVFTIFPYFFFTSDNVQEVILTSSPSRVFLMDQAFGVSVSLPPTNKTVLQGQQH